MTDSTIYLVDKKRLDTFENKIKSDKKYSSNDDNDKLLSKVVRGYLYLESAFESYKKYCQVYSSVQKVLFEQLLNAIPSNIKDICIQILRNAIVLVHMYKFIENGERYSKSDCNWEKPFNITTNDIHPLGYTGFGCDDFLLAEKRNKPLLALFT
jgi:hypothetical protein